MQLRLPVDALSLWKNLVHQIETRVKTESDKEFLIVPWTKGCKIFTVFWPEQRTIDFCYCIRVSVIKHVKSRELREKPEKTLYHERKLSQQCNFAILMAIWAATWQHQQNECAPSEDSDQPGHPPSLIRVFVVRMKKPWVLSYPVSAQRRLWSDRADAQADLSLHWAHTHFVGFVMSWLICVSIYL